MHPPLKSYCKAGIHVAAAANVIPRAIASCRRDNGATSKGPRCTMLGTWWKIVGSVSEVETLLMRVTVADPYSKDFVYFSLKAQVYKEPSRQNSQ